MGCLVVTAQEYLDNARECVRLAEHTNDHRLRDDLLSLARKWMAVAMQEYEAAPETRSRL